MQLTAFIWEKLSLGNNDYISMIALKIAPVVRKVLMKVANDEDYDLEYWLSRSVEERAAAVTSIIAQSLIKGQRMDKTKLVKKIKST